MRNSIIESIKSPLGFFVLSLLIIESFIALVIIKSSLNEEHKFIGLIIGIVIFVAIITIVSIFAWCRPRNLTYDGFSHLVDRGKMPWGTSSEEIAYHEIDKLPAGKEEK